MKKACITILFLVLLSLPLSNVFAAEAEYSGNLIPKMITNTSPSGVVSTSNEFSDANRAFDGDFATISSAWTSSATAAWLRYDFSNPVVIEQYVIYPQTTATDRAPKDWTFEGSNDGVTWNVLDTQSNITGWVDNTPKKFSFSNSNSYKNYRINITANNGSQYLALSELEMMSKVSSSTPNTGACTSNSVASSGVASASNEYSYASEAFDKNFTTIASSWTSSTTAAWLRYDFPNPIVIGQYVIYPQNTATDRAPKDWTFEGSNDGVTWNVLDTQSNITGWVDNTPKKFSFSNSNSYK
ncbi:discoidin domain-containing protein, partial [Paenibacillus farraposensis]